MFGVPVNFPFQEVVVLGIVFSALIKYPFPVAKLFVEGFTLLYAVGVVVPVGIYS